MEYVTFDFVLGFLLAVGLMVALWVPLFFFDYKAEKKQAGEPIGSARTSQPWALGRNPVRILGRRKSVLHVQATSRGTAEAICGERAITPVEDISQTGCDGKKINRPRPPDASRRVTIDVCSTNLRAVG